MYFHISLCSHLLKLLLFVPSDRTKKAVIKDNDKISSSSSSTTKKIAHTRALGVLENLEKKIKILILLYILQNARVI